MKKSIFLLLFLFLVLVITCVYQKTYILYEKSHNKRHTTVQTANIETLASLKKEHPIEKHRGTTPIPALSDKVQKNKTQMALLKEEPSEKSSFLEKLKNTVSNVMTSAKKETPTKVTNPIEHGVGANNAKKNALTTQIEEKEVVDYLIQLLKEQHLALANRDEEENKLHALIKKVLQERHIAIENMEKASLDIETRHQTRLDERDAKSQNSYTITTEKEGK